MEAVAKAEAEEVDTEAEAIEEEEEHREEEYRKEKEEENAIIVANQAGVNQGAFQGPGQGRHSRPTRHHAGIHSGSFQVAT
ncbi:hypothetical protein PZA11_005420 [Diplocarpon coronariae]